MGAPPYNTIAVGDRVQTVEGFPGKVTDYHEGPGDLGTYYVALDNDMGGGEYAEAEIWPLTQQTGQLAAHEHTAAEDYPELAAILTERLPPSLRTTAAGGGYGPAYDPATIPPGWGAHIGDGEWVTRCPVPECDHLIPGNLPVDIQRHLWDAHQMEAPLLPGGTTSSTVTTAERSQSEIVLDILRQQFLGSCPECGDPVFRSVAHEHHAYDAQMVAAKLALYLPPVPIGEQRAATTDLTPGQKAGYDEGFAQGKQGITRQPSNPTDEDFRIGFDIGWAEGVLVYREPANSWDIEDLGKDQTADVPRTSPALVNPPLYASHGSSETMLDRLDQMQARGGVVDLPMPGVRQSGVENGLNDLNRLPHEAGMWERAKEIGEVGRQFSYDWCRFRRNSHCWLPKELNQAASAQMGYAVWVPFDRGFCPRPKWKDQEVCPTGAPGPNSGPSGFLDATVPFEQGGQRGGVPTGDRWVTGSQAAFEVTASWSDVREKAKRIRSAGGVRLVSIADNVTVAHVRGDHGVYETELVRYPGKQNAAAWHCGCRWASYSWGRSGPWKRYEGRMCSHALALQYEAQSRGAHGRTLTLDEKQPAWMDQKHVHRPGDYDKDRQRYTHLTRQADLHPIEEDPPEEAPSTLLAAAMLAEGSKYAEVREMLLSLGVEAPVEIIKAAKKTTFWGRVRGVVKNLILGDGGKIEDADGKPVKEPVLYPGWHPSLGLNPHDRGKIHAYKQAGLAPHLLVVETMEGRVEESFTDPDSAQAAGERYSPEVNGRVLPNLPQEVIAEYEKKGYEYQSGLFWFGNRYGVLLSPDVRPEWERNGAKQAAGTDLRAAARAMMKMAERAEPDTTLLLSALALTHGGEMSGLDKKFKTEESLLRKMEAETHEFGYDAGRTAYNMSDSLRYTMLFGVGSYSVQAKAVLDELAGARYRERPKNYWERGDAYNGLNVAMMTPKGHPFELQFHTPESMAVKQSQVHPLFERWRTESNPQVKARLSFQMRDLFDRVVQPPGVLSIPVLKKQPMPAAASKTAADSETYRYLILHDLSGDHTTLVRMGPDSVVEVWKEGQWVDDSEYGRYFFLGEPRSDEISVAEAEAYLSSHKQAAIAVDDQCYVCGETGERDGDTYHCPNCGAEWDSHGVPREAATTKWPSTEPVATYGMAYDAAAEQDPRVVEARAFTGWASLPVEQVPIARVVATEAVVSKEAIDHFADQPYLKGKAFHMVDLGDRLALVDGHHRMAKAHNEQQAMVEAQVYRPGTPKEGSRMDTPDEFGSLFDEAAPGWDARPMTAHQQPRPLAEWGLEVLAMDEGPEATLHEEPEPALPSTDGAEEDDAEHVAARIAAVLGAAERPAPGRPADPWGTDPQQRGAALLAYAEASLRGEQPEGPNPFAHIVAGQEDNEIRAAAARSLQTQAVKTYSMPERQAIIDEGAEEKAGNLDRLDITGTHYEALEAAARSVPEDEDMTFLDGDPNLGDL